MTAYRRISKHPFPRACSLNGDLRTAYTGLPLSMFIHRFYEQICCPAVDGPSGMLSDQPIVKIRLLIRRVWVV